MNGQSHKPLSDADIVAARERAASGEVLWDRQKAVATSIAKAKAKQAAEALERRRTFRARMGIVLTALLMLALLAWLWVRRH